MNDTKTKRLAALEANTHRTFQEEKEVVALREEASKAKEEPAVVEPVTVKPAKHATEPNPGKHDAHKRLLEASAALAKLVDADLPTHQEEIAAAQEAVRIAEREVRSETAQ